MGKKSYASARLCDYLLYGVYRPHCMLGEDADWDGRGRGLNFYNNEYSNKNFVV